MSHYFDEHPDVGSDRATVTLAVDDRVLTLTTDRGVFSRGQVDAGTAVLLRKAPPPPATGRLLDLGCGYGPIALVLASQSLAADVWAVDVNERALELVAANAAANELTNITAVAPDSVPDAVTFDAIYSNPPVRIGKNGVARPAHVVVAEADRFRCGVPRRTATPRGRLVARMAQTEGFPTRRIASSKGYRVLEVRR